MRNTLRYACLLKFTDECQETIISTQNSPWIKKEKMLKNIDNNLMCSK